MCNLATANANNAVFFADDSDINFSLTLPPWLDYEMEDTGTGGAENQGISDDWQADASAKAGPSNFDGAWQSDNLS